MIEMEPIGVVRSVYRTPEDLNAVKDYRQKPVKLEVDPAYEEGLQSISPGDRLTVLFYFHLCKESKLTVKLHGTGPSAGVFSSRAPMRPNFIGSTDVEVLARNGCILEVVGADMVDGTPILDIKPAMEPKTSSIQ